LESAIKWYGDIKDKHWKVKRYYFHQGMIDQLGFDLLDQDKNKEALAIFTFNTHIFPDSTEVWEHLGDAYKKTSNLLQAATNYKKSLKVNPQNTSAKKKLNQLKNGT
jgi:tetratricopeptide (TPR) repeat protein